MTDTALLGTLVREKLDRYAADVKDEGWAWVDATPAVAFADLQAFQQCAEGAAPRTAPSAKPKRIEKLEAKMHGHW